MSNKGYQKRIASFFRTGRERLLNWSGRRGVPESAIVLFTALLVGIGAGLGAVVFRRLIDGVRILAYGGLGNLLGKIAPFHLLIIPAIGGAVFGPLIYRFAREAKGHGVPEVMEAVALRGGRIRPRVAVVKSLASAICIGTGGSVGREGPIAQIGSALGSTIGQVLNLPEERIRTLVACGAAGGISATFNAPIAGSIFALEVILNKLHSVYFSAVVISAVTADVIAHIFEEDVRAFSVPEYKLVSPWELFLYVGLGLFASIVAVVFSRSLYFSEDLWESLPLPEYVKPILGGLILGVVGIVTFKLDGFPRVFGVGYETISEALFNNLAIQVTLALLFFKMLATLITLGSGGSGGVFAPSLFMGAMLGEAFGRVANQLFPQITAPSGAYALVGMAAVFSGAAHAPVTAIIILFEMTGDYHIILPLMLATGMSTVVSHIISRESIYTLKLTRRGVRLDQRQDIDIMQGVKVAEAMSTKLEAVPLDMPLRDLVNEFSRTHHHGLPVVDASGGLAGVVSIRDLEHAMSSESIEGKRVADIATTEGVLVAYPDEPMWKALRHLGAGELSVLPVVGRDKPNRLVGVVRRRNVVHAYNQAITRHAHHQHRSDALRLGKLDKASFFHIEIPTDSPVVGRRVSTLNLPKECVLVSVRRNRKLFVVNGSTVINPEDRLTLFAQKSCMPVVQRYLKGGMGEEELPESQLVVSRQVVVSNDSKCVGLRLHDLELPPDCILASINHNGEQKELLGDTVLEAGDEVELIGVEEELGKIIERLF